MPFWSNFQPVFHSARSDWFMNGNYLIIIVTVGIILPLAMMKHLGASLTPHTPPPTPRGTVDHPLTRLFTRQTIFSPTFREGNLKVQRVIFWEM